MKLRPIPASEWIGFLHEHREMLQQFGGVAVNDKLLPLWEFDYDILLPHGGRGGGKTEAICDALLHECMNSEYFKCYYGRKVFDTVRGSCFATLVYCIRKSKLEHLFHFSEAENSSMVITCKENGNSFIPFGADKADKLKSIKDPTHVWCEEFDQFTLADFEDLYPTLRTIRGANRFVGSFNTSKVKSIHWIRKLFFPNLYEGKDANDPKFKDMFKGKRVKRVFVNYPDNYFLNHEEYEQTLLIAAGFNEQKFEEIAKGEWGSDEKNNTFIYALRKKYVPNKKPGYAHLIEGLEPDYKLPLILSFDFNVEPITCSVWQHAHDMSWISGIQEYRLLNSDIFELCERILNDHSQAYFKITGDASGRSRTAITRGNKNYFQIIKKLLKVNSRQFVLPSSNPAHANTRVLANLLLSKHPALMLDKSMQYLLADIDNVEIDEHGGIAKGKDKHLSHLLDTMLYYFWNFHRKFLEKYKAELPKKAHDNMAEIN